MPELKIKNRLKKVPNNDKIIQDNLPFVKNNISPLKDSKIGKLKKYEVFVNDYLNETKESKSTGEKINYPNKFDLIKQSKFGKLDLNHSFTSGKAIEHILLFIFKSKYLTKVENKSLLSSNPTFKIFHNMLLWSKRNNFDSLLITEKRHFKQTEVDHD